jgi:hypothetical protein
MKWRRREKPPKSPQELELERAYRSIGRVLEEAAREERRRVKRERGPLRLRILVYAAGWVLIALITIVSLAPISILPMIGIKDSGAAALACAAVWYALFFLAQRWTQPWIKRILPNF